MKSVTKIATIVIGLATIAALAACAPGSSNSGSTTVGGVSKDIGTKKISLSVVTTPESGAPLKVIIAKFEKLHPNVTVTVEKTNFSDYNKGLALSLASPSAPDIALLNLVGNIAKDKLVIPLTGYEKLYKWDTVFPSNLLKQWKVTKDLVGLNGDALYAVPTSLNYVGVYYNKSLATKVGITAPPTSLDEFKADLAQAKSAGEVPLQVGASQGHASFIVQEIGQSIDGATASNAWALGTSGSTFDTAGNREGADDLTSWSKSGYIPASANGTDLATAVGKFGQGQGVFFIDGNWDAGTIGKALGSDAGFFAFPGSKATAIGGTIAYAISSKSKNQNAAAAFLDFMHSNTAASAQFAAGFLPVDVSAVTATTSLDKDIVAQYALVNKDNGIVAFNNNATASMADTLSAKSQELIAGKTTTADAITAIQADWSGTYQ